MIDLSEYEDEWNRITELGIIFEENNNAVEQNLAESNLFGYMFNRKA